MVGFKPNSPYRGKLFEDVIDIKRKRRMTTIDAFPQELRELVNEYGLRVVQSFLDLGVTKPKHIRHVVESVLDEFSPTRGSNSLQGPRRRYD